MGDTLNRRDFLVYGGATIAGVTLGEAGRRLLARADAKTSAWHPAGEETSAVSVCRECAAGCGVRVRLMDRVPVKIDGNPLCPIARGRLCAKGQAALESYFDPDRLIGPARRTGPRGKDQWTPVSWDEALDLLASRLSRARSSGGAVVALGTNGRGPVDDTWTSFWAALNAQTVWTLPPTADRLTPRFAALTGSAGDPIFDLEHATHVLSFGAPIVEDWLSPLWAQRSYGRFRRGAGRPRGRLVQVDPRRTLTARKADEWLAVPPERQAALAYGIASVLLREDRVDRAPLAAVAGNFADFENDVVARYTPDAVAVATGVPVVTLLRLARDLAATPQPLVVVAADATPDLVDAAFALNALVGALDRPGGVFAATRRGAARARVDAVDALAGIHAGANPPAVLVLQDASALRSVRTPLNIGADLARCDFIVSLSPYLDETTAVADLLLPTHTPLESWHALTPPASDGSEKFACAEPAAVARLDTRDVIEVLHLTATRLGGDVPAACPFASTADAARAELARIWGLRRGVPYATAFETNWAQQLERGGWWVPQAASRDAFVGAALAAGGWVDPYFSAGELRQTLVARGGLTFVPPAARVAVSRTEDDSHVSLASSDGGTTDARAHAEWPLRLVPFTPVAVNLAGSPNQPILFELLGQPDGAPWQVWAELSPETAHEYGVRHGSTIRITSTAGSIDADAIVVERTPPGTIAVAFVPALRGGGRWARLMSADVRRLWDQRAGMEPIDVRVTPV